MGYPSIYFLILYKRKIESTKSMRKSIQSGTNDSKNTTVVPTDGGYWAPSGYTSAPIHGVNVVLAGAMLSGIILIMFILCYCCHKNDRKNETHLSNYGRYPELPLEVFTVGSADTVFDSEALTCEDCQEIIVSPPPAYETVVDSMKKERLKDVSDLPTYEYAVQHLEGPWR